MYDSLAAAKSQLDDQIRKSSAVLASLQAAGTMVEGLVKAQWRASMMDFGAKVGRALTDLDSRIKVLEARAGNVSAPSPPSQPNLVAADTQDPRILQDRVSEQVVAMNERIRTMEKRDQTPDSHDGAR